jgi:hypothetical protein
MNMKSNRCFMAYYISLTHVLACTLQLMCCLRDRKLQACVPVGFIQHLQGLFTANHPRSASTSLSTRQGATGVEWLHSFWDPHLNIPQFMLRVYPAVQSVLDACSIVAKEDSTAGPATGPGGVVLPAVGGRVQPASIKAMRPATNLIQLNMVCAAESFCTMISNPESPVRFGATQDRNSLQEFAQRDGSHVAGMMLASEAFMRGLGSSILTAHTARLFKLNVTRRKKRRRGALGAGTATDDDGSSDASA